jgi:Tetratricopeptide repeat
VLTQSQRRKEALALAQDTYDRRRRVLGEDHPDTLQSATVLATILESSGRRAEALRIRSQMPRERRTR